MAENFIDQSINEYRERMAQHDSWVQRDHEDMLYRQTLRGGTAHGSGDGWLFVGLLVTVPVVVLYLAVTGLARGADWLARQSLLAPLFPAPGDSPARYALSLATLALLVPGGITWIAVRVRDTRLRWLRLLLIPAAVLLLVIILQLTQTTATAELVRLPS